MKNLNEILVEHCQSLTDEQSEIVLGFVVELLNDADSSEEGINNIKPLEKQPKCPHCNCNEHVTKYGKTKGKKQRYLCSNCSKTFSLTTNTIMRYSHFGEYVWSKAISDTLNGISIDKTAKELEIAHSTVFNMRHKVLIAIEKMGVSDPIELNNIAELDETYVLESDGTTYAHTVNRAHPTNDELKDVVESHNQQPRAEPSSCIRCSGSYVTFALIALDF